MAKKRATANVVDQSGVGEILAPRPTVIEPQQSRVDAAMKAFPGAVANGGNFWSGPLVTSDREWHAPLSRMANLLCDNEFTLTEAAWAVYRLAELGRLVAGPEKTNSGELFWRTTPALWDWWHESTPSPPPAAPSSGATTDDGEENETTVDGAEWDRIERELLAQLTPKLKTLFDPLWKHRNAAVKWKELRDAYSGSTSDRAIQQALKAIPNRVANCKRSRVNIVPPSTVERTTTVTMTVVPRGQKRAEK